MDCTANAMPWFVCVTVAPTVVKVTGIDSGSHPTIAEPSGEPPARDVAHRLEQIAQARVHADGEQDGERDAGAGPGAAELDLRLEVRGKERRPELLAEPKEHQRDEHDADGAIHRQDGAERRQQARAQDGSYNPPAGGTTPWVCSTARSSS
jgi:hypothetical protein